MGKTIFGSVTLDLAIVALRAARAKAEEIGVSMSIAVVDEGTNLIAFERMDGAWLGSIRVTIDKAYTARAFDTTTRQLGKDSQFGAPAFGIATTDRGRVVIIPGGVPLEADGVICGAIGVGGGMPDQDEAVAKAGAQAFAEATAKAAAKRAA
jgi:uncharacterized protein GlcG (DUF336 family)